MAAIVSGTPAQPVLTGPPDRIGEWQGAVSLIAATALQKTAPTYPEVVAAPTGSSNADSRQSRASTAQTAQTMLFLLTMVLAGMVLSNLVEEKGNKIIEVLAAAIPMESVFLGKLFAMLGVSLVGIATWGLVGGGFLALDPTMVKNLPVPAVGWPLLIVLGVVYFSMAYLLLGSVFLSIGSLASTVREVQTLSMPVTMMQLMVFFLASYAMTQPGTMVEIVSVLFPFSSPFAMLARAAQDPALLPHVAAVLGQAAWVLLLVRLGSTIFRKRVMKSGPSGGGGKRRGWVLRSRAAAAVAATGAVATTAVADT
jgi:ABC-2 type transport system permease protein